MARDLESYLAFCCVLSKVIQIMDETLKKLVQPYVLSIVPANVFVSSYAPTEINQKG